MAASAAARKSGQGAGGVGACPTGSRPALNAPALAQRDSLVFSNLSPGELSAATRYLQSRPELNLTKYSDVVEANQLAMNWIWIAELWLPNKTAALQFLDGVGPQPPREARVVLTMGASSTMAEVVVGPLPNPTYYRYLSHDKQVPPSYNQRASDIVEYALMSPIFDEAFAAGVGNITRQLLDGYDVSATCGEGISSGCLLWMDSAPKGTRETRNTMFWFVFDLPGVDLAPTGLEARLDHTGLDSTQWSITEWLWWGQSFNSTAAFVSAWQAGQLTVPPNGFVPANISLSSFEPRGAPMPPKGQIGAQHYEPNGHRFSVQGSHVRWLKWDFSFNIRDTSGMGLFNIKYAGNRVAYEVSLQEAGAFYSGAHTSAMQQHTMYMDTAWSMGNLALELIAGIDCPMHAQLLPMVHYTNSGPYTIQNSVCVFEWDSAMPLRRHYEAAFDDMETMYGSWAAGVQSSVLVVRSISTVYNYDYVFDYLFYRNGVMEVAVTPTGYPQATYYNAADPTTKLVGNPLSPHIMGTVHDHLFNYKVDVELLNPPGAPAKNRFRTDTLTSVCFNSPVQNSRPIGNYICHKELVTTNITTESAFTMNPATPKSLIFESSTQRNSWGSPKGYKLNIKNYAYLLYPPDYAPMNHAGWARQQLAVTKYKDGERFSSMHYDQNTPTQPCLNFSTYMDGESLVDTDIVAWVTIGQHHVPTAEDGPTTATPGHRISFVLHPYNFFDYDPSMDASDVVFIDIDDTVAGAGHTYRDFGTDHNAECAPTTPATGAYGNNWRKWKGAYAGSGLMGRRRHQR